MEASNQKIVRAANIAANIACVIITILLASPFFLYWFK